MKNIQSNYPIIFVILFLSFSCQQDDVVTKSITISEVRAHFNQIPISRANGREESIGISWEEGTYKDVSTGDALVFPIDNRVHYYAKTRDGQQIFPLENIAHALAYKTLNGELNIDYVQKIPTDDTEYFTGFITVNTWEGEPRHIFKYKNGLLIETESKGRSEDIDCFWIDHQVCTTLTVGDEVYLGNCKIVGSYYYCNYNDSPSGLGPDDFNNEGGGNNGSIGNLCPHPSIEGAFIECNSCVELNEFGNCVDKADKWEEENIDDSDLADCLKDVLTNLKDLNKGVGQIVKDFSGQIEGLNWKVASGNTRNTNAITNAFYDNATGTVTTTFSTTNFRDASDLSIARTILHEAIHAHIVALSKSNPSSFVERYAQLYLTIGNYPTDGENDRQHAIIADNLVDDIALSLKEYGQSLGYDISDQYYEDLAWGGLSKTADGSLSPWFTNNVKDTESQKRIQDVISIEQRGKDDDGNTKDQEGANTDC